MTTVDKGYIKKRDQKVISKAKKIIEVEEQKVSPKDKGSLQGRVSLKLSRYNMVSSLYYFEPSTIWLMMAHFDNVQGPLFFSGQEDFLNDALKKNK